MAKPTPSRNRAAGAKAIAAVTLVVALIVGGILLGLLKEFTLTAFDPTMARSAGYPVFALDLLLLLLVSATIVVITAIRDRALAP